MIYHNPEPTRRILREPFANGREWRAHGIGMLRTYLDPDQRVRLNLWHHCLVNPGISTLHTHPWDFESRVICGSISDIPWDRVRPGDPGAQQWNEATIGCGPHFEGIRAARTAFLRPGEPNTMWADMQYQHKAATIHSTRFRDGSATVMYRTAAHDADHAASVFWPHGEEWGDATRDVTADEIARVCLSVLCELDVL